MTRRFTAGIAVLAVASLIGWDLKASPPNPYAAPPILAIGSGLSASGGFCGALPN